VKVKTTYLLCGPLEASNDRVLDFIQVLNSLGAVNEDVRASGVGAEAPDLPGLGHVILILVGQVPASDLKVVPSIDVTLKEIMNRRMNYYILPVMKG